MSGRLLNRREIIGLFGGAATLSVTRYMSVAGNSPSRRPNLLFLLADDQCFDTIHALGNDVIQTPNLDALVHNGATFTQAFVPNPACAASAAAVLTGCDGFRSGVRFVSDKINATLPTWPQLLEKSGYLTRYIGKWHNDGRPEDRGFHQVRFLCTGETNGHVVKFEGGGKSITGFSSELFAEAVIEFLKSAPPDPFLAYVAFTTPHSPRKSEQLPEKYRNMYNPSTIPLPANFMAEHPFDNGDLKAGDEQLLPWPRTPEAVRAEIADYYCMISSLDERVGEIMATLGATGLAANTIVIYASDNGVALGQHGLLGNSCLYEHSLRVPLIVSGPGIPKDVRFDASCYLYDIYPTICDLVGIETPKTVEGMSLMPILTGKQKAVRSCILGSYKDLQRMIRTEGWKLIWYPQIDKMQLFEVAKDPLEMSDLANDPAQAQRLAELSAKLADWMKLVGDNAKAPKISAVANVKEKPPAVSAPTTPSSPKKPTIASKPGVTVKPGISSSRDTTPERRDTSRDRGNSPRRRNSRMPRGGRMSRGSGMPRVPSNPSGGAGQGGAPRPGGRPI